MDEVEVSTVVYAPPEEMYEFLLDFPGYARYSEYIDRVTQDGDGTPGTNYDLVFSWWKLTYTARSEVTGVDEPERIDWRIVKDIDADGYWYVEEVSAPDGVDVASRVVLHIEFDPDSASSNAVDLPRLVSLDWVIEKVKPLIHKEATRIVERVVADIEGERRDVDLAIQTGPDSV
ncbi:SRPBCC family protein [Halomicroarcula sp. S1AR25-4]|uniref:type II toxin-antitoxin system RatA family toxin n=1 Tax=Haloarcula sp. S1AR25-4 TaxID=2950538 RepID=UPI0028766228|nr:SRPBCC family protein [Halomicroarcula sp. S1AR25-4]MDS0277263.1 SRPBCC family protein [Halomicroarcula sp. S1AR25-4]